VKNIDITATSVYDLFNDPESDLTKHHSNIHNSNDRITELEIHSMESKVAEKVQLFLKNKKIKLSE
jgi:hypothetical protein